MKTEWQTARDAEVARLYREGISLVNLSKRFGIGISWISQILTQRGVSRRGRGRPRGFVNDVATRQRNESIVQLYQEGLTLAIVGQKFGITRERVRQILKCQEVSKAEGGRAVALQHREVRKAQDKEALYLARFGHTAAEHRRLLQMDHESRKAGVPQEHLIMYRFRQARNNLQKHYSWSLTLAQWWAIWEASGKWLLHGRGTGYYGMVRLDRSKGFEPGNVEIREFRAITKSPRWTKRLRDAQRPPEVRQTLREAFEQAALEMSQVSEEEIQQVITGGPEREQS